MKIFRNISIYTFIGLVFTFSSCKKEKTETYTLPPVASMDMDFSSFTSLQKSAMVVNDSLSNYKLAKSVVSFWASVAAVHSVIPVTAFKKASTVTPVKTERGTWQWIYNFAVGSDDYLSVIEASINTVEDSVNWTLSIAQVQTDFSFTYCTGKSAVDVSGGWWKIYYPSELNAVPYLKVDWTYENENVATLRYTNIIASDANNGSYIEFGKDMDIDFNRYFKLYIKNYESNTELNNKTISIDWHNTNKNGQISIDNSIYGCWDTNLVNKISCE